MAAAAALNFVVLVISTLALPATIFLLLLKSPGRRSDTNGRQRLPPSPPGLPLLGHLHLLGSLPHRSLRFVAAAHGPVVLLRLGRAPTVLVSSAAGTEEVMRTRDLAFASRPRHFAADRLLYGCRDVAFAPYGEYWRQARRVCVAHLLSARRIRSDPFRRVRAQEAAALVDRVRSCSGSSLELGALLTAYANNVVSRAAVGDETSRGLFGTNGNEVRKVFTDFQELLAAEPLGEVPPWLGWVDALTGFHRRLDRTFRALDAVLDKVIDDRRRRAPEEEDHRRDFVDVLLDVNRNETEYGVRLETNEIKAIILDMFAGGTDSTTTAMEWAMVELVTHPRAMRKLQDEVRHSAASLTEEHLEKLAYLKAVIKETLRLHAPIPLLVPHVPPADAEILGYRVPAGTHVVVNAWAIARDPAMWGPDAEEFVPERFLPGGAAADVDYRQQGQSSQFQLLPFGAGRRGCPGIGFAEQSIAVALANLLYHFDWEPAALDMTEKKGLAVHIRSGLPLRAKPWTSHVFLNVLVMNTMVYVILVMMLKIQWHKWRRTQGISVQSLYRQGQHHITVDPSGR